MKEGGMLFQNFRKISDQQSIRAWDYKRWHQFSTVFEFWKSTSILKDNESTLWKVTDTFENFHKFLQASGKQGLQ